MQVACVYGDIYLPSLQPEDWKAGAIQKCWLASRTAPTPNGATDLLLCSATAKQAWTITWLREDVRRNLYAASVQRQVNFHSSGHGGSRFDSEWWSCKNAVESIECY